MPLLPTRRQAILGALSAIAAAASTWPQPLLGAASSARRLFAGRRTLEINGKPAPVLSLATGDGTPLRFSRGERFQVTLENQLDEPTLIHWHGLTPPSDQDGTPGLSQPPLPPGARYDYDFPLARAGTFWMHSHEGLQRAELLAAPLIIADPADAGRDEMEIVVFLSDFSFRPPEELLAALTGSHGAMHAMGGMEHGAIDDRSMPGMAGMEHGSMADMPMRAGGAAMAMDLNDIDFDAYLANDRSLVDPEIVRVERGGRVRLRIINGAAATNFWIELGALSGDLIAVDGNAIVPRRGRRFPLVMAQRFDLRVSLPGAEGAYPILAQREGAGERADIVLATPKASLRKLPLMQSEESRPLDLALEQRLVALDPLSKRAVDRTLGVDLTGDMMRFVWGINGKRYGEDTPLLVRAGERVALVMRNRTPMSHPMHLHGHRFQVVAVGERRFAGALRDTVLVPAMGSVAITFDADNPGKWAFHCHNEYHMAAGMMTSLQYEA